MSEPQHYLKAAQADALRQTFSLDHRTVDSLDKAQEVINRRGKIGFSRSVIIRVAIQALARQINNAMRFNNHAALDQLRQMAWSNSSKRTNYGRKAVQGKTPGNKKREAPSIGEGGQK